MKFVFVSKPGSGVQKWERRLSREGAERIRQRRITRAVVTVSWVCSFALGGIVFHFATRNVGRIPSAPEAVANVPAAPASADSAEVSSVTAGGRPVYRHSIVAGGVRSQREVADAVRRDPVVAAHYAAVNVSQMHEARLDQPMLAHVSYRIGDKVYWTSKPVALPTGERVMTDGKTILRARCGNIISAEPLGPALETAEEPALPDLDVIVDSMPLDPGMPLDAAPPLPPTVNSIPQVVQPVPEPGTFVLVGAGIGAAAMRYIRRRNQRIAR